MIRLHYYTFNRLIVKDKQNHIAAKKYLLFSVKPRYTLYKAVLRSSDESNLILNGTNNMSNKPTLLNDDDMQRFISDGYLTIQADFPGAFHRKIYDQARCCAKRDSEWSLRNSFPHREMTDLEERKTGAYVLESL